MTMISGLAGLFSDSSEATLGVAKSVLAGIAAALAVALTLAIYLRSGRRNWRAVLRHGLAGLAAAGLFAFVAHDMHHAALAYLGLNPSKPAVEFEIRMPNSVLGVASDAQIELHTDRNQRLAEIAGASALPQDIAVLRGAVVLDHVTADRMLVVSLPGRGTLAFKLRLAANPARSAQFGPWHLVDRVAPAAAAGVPQDAFAIRYRVL